MYLLLPPWWLSHLSSTCHLLISWFILTYLFPLPACEHLKSAVCVIQSYSPSTCHSVLQSHQHFQNQHLRLIEITLYQALCQVFRETLSLGRKHFLFLHASVHAEGIIGVALLSSLLLPRSNGITFLIGRCRRQS